MRTLIQLVIPVEAGNRALEDARLPRAIKDTIDRVNPEAVYYGAQDGKRTAWMVFDLKDVSDIPSIVEPLFKELNAAVHFVPVMNGQDLQSGLAKISAR